MQFTKSDPRNSALHYNFFKPDQLLQPVPGDQPMAIAIVLFRGIKNNVCRNPQTLKLN